MLNFSMSAETLGIQSYTIPVLASLPHHFLLTNEKEPAATKTAQLTGVIFSTLAHHQRAAQIVLVRDLPPVSVHLVFAVV
jgi:hypothetical protein